MTWDFQSALANEDLQAIRRCPKSDLHNHFMMGGDRRFVLKRTQRRVAPLKQKLRSIAEMHQWVQRNIGDIFDTRAGRLLAFEASLQQAKLMESRASNSVKTFGRSP